MHIAYKREETEKVEKKPSKREALTIWAAKLKAKWEARDIRDAYKRFGLKAYPKG